MIVMNQLVVGIVGLCRWIDRMSSIRSRYKQNRLQQLRGFCHAARAKSISKAAHQMLLSQPSVSLQIKALERELGVQLFQPMDRASP